MLEIEISKGAPVEGASMGKEDKMRALDFLETIIDDARAKAMSEDGMDAPKAPRGEMSEEEERKYLEG